jgi:hypothetical protein
MKDKETIFPNKYYYVEYFAQGANKWCKYLGQKGCLSTLEEAEKVAEHFREGGFLVQIYVTETRTVEVMIN